MSDSSIQPIVSALLDIVSNSPTQRVLGARLGAMLKATSPDFNPALFGCRNLREFIRTRIPEIEERGRSGPDLLYGLASSPRPQQISFPVPTAGTSFVPPPTTAFNWRAFTNPSYPYLLAANAETGEFKVVALGIGLPAPWVPLAKPTPEDHLAIARAFLSTRDATEKTSLEALLAEPKWFIGFSAAAKRLGLANAWGSFRTAQLRARFEDALREANIPQKATPVSEGSPRALAAPTEAIHPTTDAQLRDLVLRIVGEMSIEQLRELRLPVGRVFDLLSHR